MSTRCILHVVFSSRIAGSERYCIDLANRQAAEGHVVHVAGMRSSPLRTALSEHVRFHPFTWFLRGIRLRRLIAQLAPDVCHAHLSAACKALKGVPPHQRTVATLHVGYKPHQHAWLSGVICVNNSQAGRLGDYRGMVRTIPNWLPQAPSCAQTVGLREQLGLGKGVFLVGAVGRLHPSKGMDVLISAFRANAPLQAALVIVGEGPDRRKLERLSAGDPRIHLIGYRPVVHDYLREFDLFVCPSREESFGLAVIEAMSVGLPVIATAAEGPAEYLQDQPVSLVPPDSVGALAAEICRAYRLHLENALPKLRYNLSPFDPSTQVKSVMGFYQDVLEPDDWRSPGPESRAVALAT